MAFYNTRALALDHISKERPRRRSGSFGQRSRRGFGSFGQRLTSLLRGSDDAGDTGRAAVADPVTTEMEAVDRAAPRFALARHGYDRVAVDEYVGTLERELAALDRELAELRGGAVAADQVASELKRIGEQTSVVLMAAHEQREEMLSRARADAERRVEEATATANAVTAQSELRLRELKAETDAAHRERARLLDDLRSVSTALAAVADAAEARIPATQP
jgi:cell division septum initiation protein DivIVA